jgi:hypothetical protein
VKVFTIGPGCTKKSARAVQTYLEETYGRHGFIRDGTGFFDDNPRRSGRRVGPVDDGLASGIAPERAARMRQHNRQLLGRWPSRRQQRIKRHRVFGPDGPIDGRIEASANITRTFGQSASSPSGSNSSRATV